MKISYLLPVLIVLLSANLHAQIHSTAAGGYWNDPGTWVGSVIPGSENDVVIDGQVILASASGYTILTEHCKNLTIAASGSLKNGDYGGGSGIYPLEVMEPYQTDPAMRSKFLFRAISKTITRGCRTKLNFNRRIIIT